MLANDETRSTLAGRRGDRSLRSLSGDGHNQLAPSGNEGLGGRWARIGK